MEWKLTKLISYHGTIDQVPKKLLLSFRDKKMSKLSNRFKSIIQKTLKNLAINEKIPSRKQKKLKSMSRNRECSNRQNENFDFYQQDKNYSYFLDY